MISKLTLQQEQTDLILGALDSLGVALTETGHTWTEGERAIYEQAVAILAPPASPPLDQQVN